ncbi:hypothetical protein VTN77DRAFT_3131 [Rasamsonia byssochlamydoides]|uniref:uncharacterized protein n=1 Tax=Rasamsonia byssochlamydoides TaxID=89139 RepID=UPI0037429E7D
MRIEEKSDQKAGHGRGSYVPRDIALRLIWGLGGSHKNASGIVVRRNLKVEPLQVKPGQPEENIYKQNWGDGGVWMGFCDRLTMVSATMSKRGWMTSYEFPKAVGGGVRGLTLIAARVFDSVSPSRLVRHAPPPPGPFSPKKERVYPGRLR